MNNYPFDAVIFDMDGTLIDSESADFEACQMLYGELGATLTLEHWANKVVGRLDGYDHLFAELVRESNNGLVVADLWRRLHELWDITTQHISLMPGVDRLLPDLHADGVTLAVASASDRQWVSRWLTHFNLTPYFQTIATGDDITHNKPAPDIYHFTATQLGVQPERCLAFEDSVAGVQSAKSAGMTVIAVSSPIAQSFDFSRADHLISGLDSITAAWISTLRS